MKGPNTDWKKSSELTLADFHAHPVWTWVEDERDESLVMPVDCGRTLPSNEDYGTLFVASEFRLSDGTIVPGAVLVRMSDRRGERGVYGLELAGTSGNLFTFPLHPFLQGLVSREALANWLRKPMRLVFPMVYDTSYVFADGEPLIGRIE